MYFSIVLPMQKENETSVFLKGNQSNHGKNLFCKEEAAIKTKFVPFYTFVSILAFKKIYFLNEEITISNKHVFSDNWNINVSEELKIYLLYHSTSSGGDSVYFHNILDLLFP